VNEDRRKNRRGRKPADVDSGVCRLHRGPADGYSCVASGLVKAPDWWPFTWTTRENLRRLKRERAVSTVRRWLQLPQAPF